MIFNISLNSFQNIQEYKHRLEKQQIDIIQQRNAMNINKHLKFADFISLRRKSYRKAQIKTN